MNCISFSLWGDLPKYCVGAVKQCALIEKFYPGWVPVFYVNKTVPGGVLSDLRNKGAIILDISHLDLEGYCWRFLIHDEPWCDRFLIRDCDSRINQREVDAVKAWIASGKRAHVIRDHPSGHHMPMMGGLWGAIPKLVPSMLTLLPKSNTTNYMSDQNLLAKKIWPKIKKDTLAHDVCTKFAHESEPFPTPLKLSNLRFCGEVFDEHDRPRDYDWEPMVNYAVC